MNFGDRERVIMPNGNGAGATRRRERPTGEPALTGLDPYAAALCVDTLDPFDEVIRLGELDNATRLDEVGDRAPAPAAVAEMVSPHELADRIRAEARLWSENHRAEADETATQTVLEPAPQVDAEAAAAAEALAARELAERIRAEAKRWSQDHVAEADQIATQRILEAEFAARQIVEQARVAKRAQAEPEVVEVDEPTPAPDEAEPESPPAKHWLTRPVGILAAAVLVFAIIAGSALIRAYVAQPFTVESSSMEPALHQGDRLLVNKVAYRLGDLARGDVVVIDSDHIPGASPELSNTLVKRVVGLPGESVSALDGRLFVDGSPIDQPWLGDVKTPDFGPVILPPGSVFVLGDNRGSSIDSRNFGPVPTDAIVGRVEGVIWPLGDIGRV